METGADNKILGATTLPHPTDNLTLSGLSLSFLLKENIQNPNSGSKNSENQNNDAVL